MKIHILTLFPEMFAGPFSCSILKRAVDEGAAEIRIHNLRDWAAGRHRITDDSPFGGGVGMVLKPEPVYRAVEELRENTGCRVILFSPQGKVFRQETAQELAREKGLILICGRYEGVDERIRALADRQVSIGDYVLTGGEIPAMVVVDAVVRLLPGVLGGGEAATTDDSFAAGLLEGPHYTKPRSFRGLSVPEVLLAGNHAAVRRWRRKESLRCTLRSRPELLLVAPLGREDLELLAEIEKEEGPRPAFVSAAE